MTRHCVLLFICAAVIVLHARAQSLPTGDLWQLFETIDTEVLTEQSCPVVGTIPDFVSGLLLKNGFGKFEGAGFKFNFLYVRLSVCVLVCVHVCMCVFE